MVEGGEPSRRRIGWGAVAAVVLAFVGLWWGALDGSAAREPTRPEAPDAEPPAVSAAPVGPAAPGRPAPAGPALPEDPIELYREQTRYPPGSGRLGEGRVDLLEPNRRYERLSPVPATRDRGPDGIVSFVLEADHYYYSGDEVVDARLRVRRGGRPHAVRVVQAWAEAEAAEGTTSSTPLRFEADGALQRSELDLAEHFPDHLGPIQLHAVFEYAPGEREEATLRLFSTPVRSIPAHFTGDDRDVVRGGSLLVEVGIEVQEAGFYRIDANLYDAAGAPVAFAAFKGDLETGRSSVPLEFLGLLLRDVGVAGPYELRQLRGYRFREGAHPDRQRMRDAEHTHWTHAYELASFSEEEYTSPHKQRMIELLEADRRAGLVIEHPPLPGI